MTAYRKEALRKRDEERLEEMQREINEAEAEEDAEEVKEHVHHKSKHYAQNEKERAQDKAEEVKEPEEAPSASDEAVQKLQKELEDIKAQLQAKNERLLRLQADFDNFRRRSRQEKDDLANVIKQGIFKGMLPILDNFERALASSNKEENAKGLRAGIEMVYKSLKETLEKDGLQVIETEGKAFDPNFHQAVLRVEDPEKEDGSIAQELQKGYMVHGHVIRPSMVQVVSNS